MSKKEVKKSESVVVDVDTDVTSVSTDAIVLNECKPCVDVPVESKPKRKSQSKSKKVADIALETQIADMEAALENAKLAIESAVADNEKMADELNVSVAENKSLRKELYKCKQDYKRLQGENRANCDLVSELHKKLVTNDGIISGLQEKNAKYVDELALKDAEISEWEFDVALRDSKLAFYESMNVWQRIKFVFLGTKMYKCDIKEDKK